MVIFIHPAPQPGKTYAKQRGPKQDLYPHTLPQAGQRFPRCITIDKTISICVPVRREKAGCFGEIAAQKFNRGKNTSQHTHTQTDDICRHSKGSICLEHLSGKKGNPQRTGKKAKHIKNI